MKMIFRPSTKIQSHSRRKKILTVAFTVFFLFVIIFHQFSFNIFSRPLFYVLKPFLEIRKKTENWWQKIKVGFSEKKNLWEENKILKEKIMEMEARLALFEILEKENILLKSNFSAEEKQDFILGSIIFRPPKTPYDILIVDAGKKNGVKAGMQASAFGKILLGYVIDVFENESKIKLISSFKEETNVLLESSATPAIAIGRGGENFEIMLPKSIPVAIGEKIITMGKNSLLIGIVEKIEYQPTDPYQKIFFRLPVNIQTLTKVFLK